jgi:hypothetical protein
LGRFNNLFDVGQVMMDVLTDRTGVADIRVAPPLDTATSQAEAIRITLMYVTPQPTHVNDPLVRNPDGTRAQPPVTLSAYYLVTTYGFDNNSDAVQAHNLLGRVLQAFHTDPEWDLPLTLAGATPVGAGQISFVQMTSAIEMLEKVFTPLQAPHRPWALFEAAPVQLPMLRPDLGEAPVVQPGGVRLDIEVRTRPAIERITPSIAGQGGRIRIDMGAVGGITAVHVGRTRLAGGALTVPVPNGPVIAALPAAGPDAVLPGAYDVILAAGTLFSAPRTLTVIDPALPSVDAPLTLTHSVANPLVLDGRSLGGATRLFAWPDSGLVSPTDVFNFPVAAAANSVTVAAGDLQAVSFRPTPYRLSVQYSAGGFTPYVLMEFGP